MANYRGDSGPNVLIGAIENDYFELQDGGIDSAFGGDGNDLFYLGGAFDNLDVIDGGAGSDQIGLQGNYSGGVTLANVSNVEFLVLIPGNDVRFGDSAGNFYDYNIGSADGVVAAGGRLAVDGNRLRDGETLIFDGRDESDGSFLIYAGAGQDILYGGDQNDTVLFRGGRYQSNDFVDGGDGASDQVLFRGNYAGASAATIGDLQLIGVESLVLLSGQDTRFGRVEATPFNYEITLGNGNTTSVIGGQLTIDAGTLRPNETLTFNGSANTGGTLRIIGGSGNDSLTGGQTSDDISGGSGDDLLAGNLGGDRLDGQAGFDILSYAAATESTSTSFDQVVNFDIYEDVIDLPTSVFGFTGAIETGQLSTGSFDSDIASAVDADLEIFTAVLFQPDSGDFSGRSFIVVDGDGDGVYTAGADYVFEVVTPPFVPTDDPGASFFI